MNERARSWWQGNSMKLWRSLVLIIFGLLVWMYQREVYRLDLVQAKQVNIVEVKADRSEVGKLADKMDDGFDRLSDQIAEINQYLRE